jgi:hypothetical protein
VIVTFTVNNRPAYLRETLESWSRVRGISGHELVFRCEPGCFEAFQACSDADFAPGTVFLNGTRLGVLGNPRQALGDAFGLGAEFAVLAEEDMVVSADVLEYFAWAAGRFRDDPSVLGVTTHQHDERPGGLAGAGPADWSRDDRWHFWVWGTWRDRWERLLRDSWDTSYTENGGGPLQRGWDWGFRNRLVVGGGMRMIAPSLARSQHIGRYGGTHCSPADFDVVASRCFAGLDVPPQDYQEVATCPAR